MAGNKLTFREYMELAVEVMKESVHESREDKTSPMVGAVLVRPDGSFETGYRGEMREGDHAEYTLIDRKNRAEKLDGSLLFVTLEPCAPGARNFPKLSCSERIANTRIQKVWVGIEDPDPTVDRKGIKYLEKHGVEVEMFDADLQKQIRKVNEQFIIEAKKRAKQAIEEKEDTVLSIKEKIETKANIADFSEQAIEDFLKLSELKITLGSIEFQQVFFQLGLLAKAENEYQPTGIGHLLFGKKPQLIFPQALIRATYKSKGRHEDIETIEGPLTEQADKIQNWYKQRIGKHIDRSDVHRKNIYNYPLEVFREAIINAIVHRDYDIEGAPIYFEINEDAIVIKSPGSPVEPLKLEQIQKFSAPSLSRNPKIMYIFDQLGLVEQRGLGFDTIKELPDKYGLPLPIVTFEAPYLVITFPRSIEAMRLISNQEGIKSLTNVELRGYEWIRTQEEVSTSEYSEYFNYSQRTASRHLSKMLNSGLLATNDEKPKSSQLRYHAIS